MNTRKKSNRSISKTINNTVESIDDTLKTCDPEIQHYIAALTAENEKLVRKNAKCEAEKITLQNRIKLLDEQIEEEKKKPKLCDFIAQIKRDSSEE
ncbi:MAG: hypothetical protein NTX36_02330 [Proteobacteria bacterium]|nr:hypothetical protein [Pseudomonadota bacterium]